MIYPSKSFCKLERGDDRDVIIICTLCIFNIGICVPSSPDSSLMLALMHLEIYHLIYSTIAQCVNVRQYARQKLD